MRLQRPAPALHHFSRTARRASRGEVDEVEAADTRIRPPITPITVSRSCASGCRPGKRCTRSRRISSMLGELSLSQVRGTLAENPGIAAWSFSMEAPFFSRSKCARGAEGLRVLPERTRRIEDREGRGRCERARENAGADELGRGWQVFDDRGDPLGVRAVDVDLFLRRRSRGRSTCARLRVSTTLAGLLQRGVERSEGDGEGEHIEHIGVDPAIGSAGSISPRRTLTTRSRRARWPGSRRT